MEHVIPQEWINSARMTLFRPSTKAWCCVEDHELIPIDAIQPFIRTAVVNDQNGFRKPSVMYTLGRIYNAEPIEPIELLPTPVDGYSFTLQNGFHRYYIARTVGYSHIPATIRRWT